MKELNWQDLMDGGEGDANSSLVPGAGTTEKRRRKPRTTGDVAISKATIADILTVANLPIQISGYGRYALTSQEIDALADAWYKVIKQNPYVAKYLVQAGKLGVWGNLLFIHAQIIGARLKMFSAEQDSVKRANTAPTSRAPRTDGRPISELLS